MMDFEEERELVLSPFRRLPLVCPLAMTSLILPTDLWYLIYQYIPSDRLVLQLPLTQRQQILKRLTGIDTHQDGVDRLLKIVGRGGRDVFAHPVLWPFLESQGRLTDQALIECQGVTARALVWERYPKRQIPLPLIILAFAFPSMTDTRADTDRPLADVARYLRHHLDEIDPTVVTRLQMEMIRYSSRVPLELVAGFMRPEDVPFLQILYADKDEDEVLAMIAAYADLDTLWQCAEVGLIISLYNFFTHGEIVDPVERLVVLEGLLLGGYWTPDEIQDAIADLTNDEVQLTAVHLELLARYGY